MALTPEEAAERRRASALVRLYGITSEDYDRLLAHQGGKCAICRKPPGRIRLAVDHCHRAKKVRGLLCAYCNNKVIGNLTQTLIAAAALYMADPPADAVLGQHHAAGRPRKRRHR